MLRLNATQKPHFRSATLPIELGLADLADLDEIRFHPDGRPMPLIKDEGSVSYADKCAAVHHGSDSEEEIEEYPDTGINTPIWKNRRPEITLRSSNKWKKRRFSEGFI